MLVLAAQLMVLASLGAGQPTNLLAAYSYNPTAVSFQVEPLPRIDGLAAEHVSFTSQVKSGYPADQTVGCTVYLPASAKPAPGVLVLHEWKATASSSRAGDLARSLARGGMVAVTMPLPYHMDRAPPGTSSGELMITSDVDRTRQAFIQAVVDCRCVVQWLRTQPQVDPGRIGITGISLGAIVALLAAEVEPRISVAVTILGAADPADLLRRSLLTRGIWHGMRERHSARELAEKLRVVDARNFAGHNPHLSLLMINGYHDLILPPDIVRKTWRALGRPSIMWLNSGHLSAGIYVWPLIRTVRDYFEVHFGLRKGPEVPPTPISASLDIGILSGLHTGTVGALMLEVLPLANDGKAAATVGLTTRGPYAGIEVRPFQFGEIGYGLRPFADHASGEPFVMLLATF